MTVSIVEEPKPDEVKATEPVVEDSGQEMVVDLIPEAAEEKRITKNPFGERTILISFPESLGKLPEIVFHVENQKEKLLEAFTGREIKRLERFVSKALKSQRRNFIRENPGTPAIDQTLIKEEAK